MTKLLKNIIKNKKISIQGNRGSYSHIAASEVFGKKIEIIERDNFTDVFEDLKNSKADNIVVPIENSTHGSVYQNYDNLTQYGFEIIGEIYLKIHFHLIAHPGTKIEEINSLYTHPVGMNQIKKFLKENPKIKPIEYSDTAGSVEMIKQKDLKNSSAAASKFAAEIFEMEVLQENIQENEKNYTRFFVLAQPNDGAGLSKSQEKNKTTIQFELGEESGSLYKSLRCFADRDIALSKIESRPILNTDWQYKFYLDVEAGIEDEKMKNAMNELKGYVHSLKVLGSYAKGGYIET